jgi:hypothetical protein
MGGPFSRPWWAGRSKVEEKEGRMRFDLHHTHESPATLAAETAAMSIPFITDVRWCKVGQDRMEHGG